MATSTTLPRYLLPALVAVSAVCAFVWSLHAPRFFDFTSASYGVHWGHRYLILLHVAGGTVALATGPFLLWSGMAGWRRNVHRWVGRTYLAVGALGVGAGGVLAVVGGHPPFGLSVLVFTLAVVWFVVAFFAYRAIRNRRIAVHREWVIRSYVLTVTFVICRIAMRVPILTSLGVEQPAAIAWLSWVVPLLLTEFVLQWRRTGRTTGAAA